MSIQNDTSSRVAMLYLIDLAIRGGGYEFRAVRGWASYEDMSLDTGARFSDHLGRLCVMGYLAREDVRNPRRQVGSWIYHIAERGLESVEEIEELDLPPVEMPGPPPPPGEPRPVYVPTGALLALRALRMVAANPTPSPLLPKEPGWRTRRELTELVCGPREEDPEWLLDMRIGDLDELDDPAPWRGERKTWERYARPERFFQGDMDWLVRAGLAQRFGTIPGHGRRHEVLYRLTPTGASIIPLEWHEPTPDPDNEES
jgi:hypothetical protein